RPRQARGTRVHPRNGCDTAPRGGVELTRRKPGAVLPRWSGSARGATRAAVLSLRRIPPGLLPIYGLVFVAAMVQSALAPLGPLYAAQLHLSRVQLGELFAAAGFSTLLVVLPVGVFGDRLGSRRITIGAAVLIALSALGQGLAPDFLLLLAS